MPPTSTSPRDRDARSWLREKVYAPRRQRTLERVTQAVDVLVKARQAVSLAAIVATSKALDPSGHGISTSAVLGNADARAYYTQHRTWSHRRRQPSTTVRSSPGAPRLCPRAGRDLTRVRQRYFRLSKAVLIDRLVAVELAYAEQEERWLRANDELLALTLRAESHASAQASTGEDVYALRVLRENAAEASTSLAIHTNG